MPLNAKQAAFVASQMTGASNRDAAVNAGYSIQTAAAAGARLAKHPDILAELQRRRLNDSASATTIAHTDPMAYLLEVMNDARFDPRLRVDAAKALMPFLHPRSSEGPPLGKRAEAQARASSAADDTEWEELLPRHDRAAPVQ